MPAAAQEIPYNVEILRWARKRSRLNRQQAADSAHVSVEKISDWEDGKSAPTVRQARLLASAYDRPFLEFFSPDIPDIPPLELVPDYRFNRSGPSNLEMSSLEGVQGWAESQRLNAIALYEIVGEKPKAIPEGLRATTTDDPETVAWASRETLELPIEAQLRLRAKERPLFPNTLRQALERVGVLVLKQSGLSRLRTRGICLYHPILPVIVFGNEAPGGQAFTLAHEFAHVILGESALSGSPILAYRHGSHRRKVEGWCNAFAASFMMPIDAIKAHNLAPTEYVDSISDLQLSSLANSFAVSRHAMLIRLVNLGLVSASFYWRKKRREIIAQEESYEGGGRSLYYGSRYRNSLGDLYTGLVVEALGTGAIGYHSASEFMGIKNVRHLQDIQANFGA